MRRLLAIAAIAAAAVLSTGGTSQAATSWPARCHNFKCVNAHLNALHKSVTSVKNNLNGFFGCLDEAPATEYLDFMSSDGVNSTSGLDFTATGDSIDFWLLGIDPGNCGFATIAATVRPPVAFGHLAKGLPTHRK